MELTSGNLPGRVPGTYRFVVKTHELPDPHFSLTDKIILLVRDPRDMVTSSYMRFKVIRNTGTDVDQGAREKAIIETERKQFDSLKDKVWVKLHSQKTFSVARIAWKWNKYYRIWQEYDFLHIVRYEDLIEDPVKELKNICAYLAIEVNDKLIHDTVDTFAFRQIAGHAENNDDKINNSIEFRKGGAGDYINHLSDIELRIVKYYCKDVAQRFGYAL